MNLESVLGRAGVATDRRLLADVPTGEVPLNDALIGAFSRLACELALEWYNDLQSAERYPDVQLHVGWDGTKKVMTYRDHRARRNRLSVDSDGDPYLGKEVLSRSLSEGRFLWVPMEEEQTVPPRVITRGNRIPE